MQMLLVSLGFGFQESFFKELIWQRRSEFSRAFRIPNVVKYIKIRLARYYYEQRQKNILAKPSGTRTTGRLHRKAFRHPKCEELEDHAPPPPPKKDLEENS
ncbi:hypothetical protein TNIN_294751 [Trichonephila inaurata madagascariensis]|uniref:Uncharacterized protein n=1 Tax=Trichonephila inaurata madagascariensis TaxID=2747483 RepID=A0A8X6IF48_9ARAC|nr:hypothetical protein TNIN_294751 [Trichonephila inaurata madagascariensis]